MKQEHPKKEKVYVISTHPCAFRTGEPSEVIGVKMAQPNEKLDPRLVYEVAYFDGVRDSIPVSEIGVNYRLFTLKEMKDMIKHFTEERKEQEKERKGFVCTRYRGDPQEGYFSNGACLDCGKSVWMHLSM